MNDISNDIRHGGYIRAEKQSNIITKEIYVTMLYVYHTLRLNMPVLQSY